MRHWLTTVAILLSLNIRWKVGVTLLLSELTYTAGYVDILVILVRPFGPI